MATQATAPVVSEEEVTTTERTTSVNQRPHGETTSPTATNWLLNGIYGLLFVLLLIGVILGGTYTYRTLFPTTTTTTTEVTKVEQKKPVTDPMQQGASPIVQDPPLGASVPLAPAKPGSVPGAFATSTVAADDRTTINISKHKDNHEVVFVGPGSDLPRSVHVFTCPIQQPLPVVQVLPPNVQVDAHFTVPSPPNAPVPPTPPAQPNPPSNPGTQNAQPMSQPQSPPAKVAPGLPTSYVPQPCNQRVAVGRQW